MDIDSLLVTVLLDTSYSLLIIIKIIMWPKYWVVPDLTISNPGQIWELK